MISSSFGIPGESMAATMTPDIPMPAQPPTVQQKVGDLLEALVYMIRGGEGLDLPPGARDAAKRLVARVSAKMSAGRFPAFTADDFRILTAIARLPGPSRR